MLLLLMVESRMPRYFFDLDDGRHFFRDEAGTDCGDTHAIRAEVARTLAAIARDNIAIAPLANAEDPDRQALTASVRNAGNLVVYTAMMTFAGIWQGDNMPFVNEGLKQDACSPPVWGR